jgi:hypothetical protein
VHTAGAKRTEESRKNYLATSLNGMQMKEKITLYRIVTGDQSWVHHYQPESEHASMKCPHPISPLTKKFKVTPSALYTLHSLLHQMGRLCLPCFGILREYS